MANQFDIEKLINSGVIANELEYDRALVADRKLRMLAKENNHFKELRIKLRNIIEQYERDQWTDINIINASKIIESNKAEKIAELERQFIENRKLEIKKKLKMYDLKQENLSTILGHKSKTHMSELMNGIKPFTLRDLIIINQLLKIDMSVLVPVFLSQQDKSHIIEIVKKLNKPKIKLQL